MAMDLFKHPGHLCKAFDMLRVPGRARAPRVYDLEARLEESRPGIRIC